MLVAATLPYWSATLSRRRLTLLGSCFPGARRAAACRHYGSSSHLTALALAKERCCQSLFATAPPAGEDSSLPLSPQLLDVLLLFSANCHLAAILTIDPSASTSCLIPILQKSHPRSCWCNQSCFLSKPVSITSCHLPAPTGEEPCMLATSGGEVEKEKAPGSAYPFGWPALGRPDCCPLGLTEAQLPIAAAQAHWTCSCPAPNP